VVGLAAHAGGFLLKTSVTTEPLALVADLLYALGWALWTSVIVVFFVQIWPEAKKRQYKQALDAYEAAVGRQARIPLLKDLITDAREHWETEHSGPEAETPSAARPQVRQ